MRPPRPAEVPENVPGEWLALAEALPDRGRLLAIGPSDAGKTTLCWWLAGELDRRSKDERDAATQQAQAPGRVALVDADIGQSRIGPPASVGWANIGERTSKFYFVGAVSAEQRPSSAFKATIKSCQAAAGCQWTIVDTTGHISGDLAVALKSSKIKRLRPVHVVGIGDDPALERLLARWDSDPQVTMHRLPTPAAARSRSRSQRARWRAEAFARWLEGANLRWIAAEGRRIINAPPQELFAESPELAEGLTGLLMGFGEESGRGICLGLLHTMDWSGGRVLARCPPQAEDAALVDFGCIRLEPDGTQKPFS